MKQHLSSTMFWFVRLLEEPSDDGRLISGFGAFSLKTEAVRFLDRLRENAGEGQHAELGRMCFAAASELAYRGIALTQMSSRMFTVKADGGRTDWFCLHEHSATVGWEVPQRQLRKTMSSFLVDTLGWREATDFIREQSGWQVETPEELRDEASKAGV